MFKCVPEDWSYFNPVVVGNQKPNINVSWYSRVWALKGTLAGNQLPRLGLWNLVQLISFMNLIQGKRKPRGVHKRVREMQTQKSTWLWCPKHTHIGSHLLNVRSGAFSSLHPRNSMTEKCSRSNWMKWWLKRVHIVLLDSFNGFQMDGVSTCPECHIQTK